MGRRGWISRRTESLEAFIRLPGFKLNSPCNERLVPVHLRKAELGQDSLQKQPEWTANVHCLSGGELLYPALSRMATWRSGYAPDCKSVYPGSIPGVASRYPL